MGNMIARVQKQRLLLASSTTATTIIAMTEKKLPMKTRNIAFSLFFLVVLQFVKAIYSNQVIISSAPYIVIVICSNFHASFIIATITFDSSLTVFDSKTNQAIWEIDSMTVLTVFP